MRSELRTVVVLLLSICLPASAIADDYILLRRGESAKLFRVSDDWTVTPVENVQVIDLDKTGGVDPIVPPNKTLATFVGKQLAAVPEHKLKQETAIGLAAGYAGLAKLWRDGKLDDVRQLLDDRKAVHDRLTKALGVEDQWRAFDASLVAELTRLKLKESDIADALDSVAAGLTSGKAINPLIITAGIELVLALLSKDQEAISAAIGKLVVALLGSIGS